MRLPTPLSPPDTPWWARCVDRQTPKSLPLSIQPVRTPAFTGTALGDFSLQVRLVSEFYASPAGTVFAQLLAASVTDHEAAAYFRTLFLAGRRRAIGELWRRALQRGEVDPDIDVEVAQDILFGPSIFWLLSGHAPQSLKRRRTE